MLGWKLRPSRTLILSGEVLAIRLIVEAEEPERSEGLWSVASKESLRLREEMTSAVHRHMGPEFEIRSMSFGRGSLEILVVVGTLYYAVSRYKNFIESVELLVAQLRSLVTAFFERRVPVVAATRGTWVPGPGLIHNLPRPPAMDEVANHPAVWYLILSHAAMLTVLLWMLVRGL